MNIFSVEGGSVAKLVAGLSVIALLMSAFPVSFAAADFEGGIVEGCTEVEANNYNPDANTDDGSCTYPDPEPVLENIEVCKYTYGEGESYDTVSGWTMFITNIDPNEVIVAGPDDVPEGDIYEVVTGDNGCVTQDVDADNGPWYVVEDIEEGWYQDGVDAIGGYETEGEGDNFCVFFDYVELSKEKSSISSEYEYRCDFYNVDEREMVSGYKWSDEDNDGIKDDSEGGVEGWTITATDESEDEYSSVSVVTDENGYYEMMLPADGYWVITEESRSRWTQTAVFENGYKLTEENQEGGSITECTLYLGDRYAAKVLDSDDISIPYLYNRCDFLNHEEPRRSSGGGTRVKDRAPAPQVLGASTTAPSCGMYLNDYMRMGKEASSTEVTKLQVFLNAVGITAPLTGVFDAATDAAVRSFQMKHKAEVLTPWYMAKIVPHENPTGWVYQLTRWKINNIVCPGSEAYPVLN